MVEEGNSSVEAAAGQQKREMMMRLPPGKRAAAEDEGNDRATPVVVHCTPLLHGRGRRAVAAGGSFF